MRPRPERTAWVAYVRVSTAEQAERDLSLPAQREAIREFAARHDATIAEEYVEAGASGTDPHRPVLNRLLGDALKPTSTIGTIVVHHTSRFTRDATHARVVKSKLRKAGVRVISVMQDFADDPMGKLMEGLFECIDQYESELNGLRTSAAMREAVRQGFWPGARAPYGFRSVSVEARPGVVHHRLEIEPREAKVVREIFHLYIAGSGALSVARALNQRGPRTRDGNLWSKNRIGLILGEEALIGSVVWGLGPQEPTLSTAEVRVGSAPSGSRVVRPAARRHLQSCSREFSGAGPAAPATSTRPAGSATPTSSTPTSTTTAAIDSASAKRHAPVFESLCRLSTTRSSTSSRARSAPESALEPSPNGTAGRWPACSKPGAPSSGGPRSRAST